MNILEKANILSYHRKHLGFSGFLAQGWSTLKKQQLRFDTLLRWGSFSGMTVLDLGCGFGDFREYLNGKCDDIHYIGVDIYTEFIDESIQRFQGIRKTDFICADFTSVGLPEVDVTVASGSLNYKTEDPSYIISMIQRMWNASKMGIAFNLLKTTHVEPNNIIMGYDEERIIGFCRSLAAKAYFVDDYLEEDFTVFMRRG